MRALCVLQVSTRLGLFYIWHRLLSGISQLKKKNRETKNQKFEVRGHIVGPRVEGKKKKIPRRSPRFFFASQSRRERFAREDAINHRVNCKSAKSIQNTSGKLLGKIMKFL